MGDRRTIVLVVVAAAVMGQVFRFGSLAPYVVGGVLLIANVAVVALRRRRSIRPRMEAASFVVPLAICWLITSLLPIHSFSSRSSSEAVSGISLQPILELLVFLGVALVALAAIRSLEPTMAGSRPPMVFFLLPTWLTVTCFWSATGLYAMIRGWQMLTVAVLAWATVALGRVDRERVTEVMAFYLRWFLRSVMALAVLGALFGPIYATTGYANRNRFSWIGAHPNSSGLALSVAIVIACLTPSRITRFHPVVTGVVTVALLAAMYENHSRTCWIGIILALLVGFALRGDLTPLLRSAGTPLLAAAIVAALWFKGDAVVSYALRDESSSTFASGNGRRALWGIGFRSMNTTFDWLCGHGYGVARTLFIEEESWAGDAHNSVLNLLVSTGIIGVALLLFTVGYVSVHVVRSNLWRTSSMGIPIIALLILVIVDGATTDVLAEPNIGFVILYLVGAFAIVQRLPATDPPTADPDAVATPAETEPTPPWRPARRPSIVTAARRAPGGRPARPAGW